MDFEELSLKAQSLLRKSGLAGAPRSAVICICALAVVLICISVWHFRPQANEDFVAAGQAAEKSVSSESVQASASQSSKSEIVVDVEGAVQNPGLYTLPDGSRVGDAVTAAGGLSAEAVSGGANLAQKLGDGEQVFIPSATQEDAALAQDAAGQQTTEVRVLTVQ